MKFKMYIDNIYLWHFTKSKLIVKKMWSTIGSLVDSGGPGKEILRKLKLKRNIFHLKASSKETLGGVKKIAVKSC